ncbi:hypothetical protein V6N13_049042 [Hibiscus sabdariffa]|uniref:NAC domain-containing protein n=1 Tax=Hibiscus sabdariffa TaxID=183260 RepID=A0ABR2QYY7_9ROSI
MAAAELQLPPGFRFHPTDEELVMLYLCRKCASQPIAAPIIAEIDLYKYDPWDLPDLALYGEKEWYFFSPRDRKYPNGSRPNRAAGSGYWKATGADKPVGKPKPVGIKKALVFYTGKAPKGEKSNWIMHEYRLADVDRSARNKNSLRLDDWVLCRIYNKKGSIEKQTQLARFDEIVDEKPNIGAVEMGTCGLPLPLPLPPTPTPTGTINDIVYFDTSESVPKVHTDSSCSEQAVSPEFTCEVQSQPKRRDWQTSSSATASASNATLDFPYHYMDAAVDAGFTSEFQSSNQLSPLQDMFMYPQKPF